MMTPEMPKKNWQLIIVEDSFAICDAHNFGREIRFIHYIKHPSVDGVYGVGSGCVKYLTKEYRVIARKQVSLLKKKSDLLKKEWLKGVTGKGTNYEYLKIGKYKIRVYKNQWGYSYTFDNKEYFNTNSNDVKILAINDFFKKYYV